MKLISLNLWGGRAGLHNLLAFINAHRDVDVFCFQEMHHNSYELPPYGGGYLAGYTTNLLSHTQTILSQHRSFFRPTVRNFYGIATFVRHHLNVTQEGDLFVYREHGYESTEHMGDHARNLQHVTIDLPDGPLTIINIHGIWDPHNAKYDTPERITQSQNIINFLRTLKNPYVLCGDFNLLPDTQSVKLLEDFGLINLVRTYDITSTRTSLYTKPLRFADYIFTSPEISVQSFAVLPDEVSDHSPLYLEFR